MNKVRCPICEKKMDAQGPKEWPDWPFCCKRCRMVDLGRWLGGNYRIETPAKRRTWKTSTTWPFPPIPAVPSADPHREEA